ncbi:MAG: transcription-repair coupling factor [Chloroflexi bacterium]|nr:transcription-repair coupling factor [Chloroflexota bacterium]
MSLGGLLDVLGSVPGYRGLLDDVAAGRPARGSLLEAAKPCVIAALWRDLGRPIVVVCPLPDDARRTIEQLVAYCGPDAPIYHFAESEVLPYERLSVEAGTVHERLSALAALHGMVSNPPSEQEGQDGAEGEGTPLQPLIVVSITGLMQKTIGPALFRELVQTIRAGERFAVEPSLEQWARMGYRTVPLVEGPGTAARRGGVIDVYPPGLPQPARIDLWGDRIDTIRLFETGSQRSTGRIEELRVLPAFEVLPSLGDHGAVESAMRALDFSNCRTSERDRITDELAELMAGLSFEAASLYSGFMLHHSLLDHLAAAPDAVLVFDELAEAGEAIRHLEQEAAQMRLAKQERGDLPLGFPSPLADGAAVEEALAAWPARVELSRYRRSGTVALPFGPPPAYHGALPDLASALRERDRAPVVLATHHSRRMEELLHEADVAAKETHALDTLGAGGAGDVVDVVRVALAGGWELRAEEGTDPPLVTLLTDTELFGAAKRQAARPRRHPAKLRTVTVDELSVGQLVVHVEHGIGRFGGITVRTGSGGSESEFLTLEYAGGDKLYVPMEHLDRLASYVGGGEDQPGLTRLGSQEWGRTVSRARDATKKLAVDLLALYAARELAEGVSQDPDTPWQREMEDAFPFVETPDQQRAIEDVKGDLERAIPMDRLVCGDVGYGKTEVALRAAFKTVVSGKQVAVLVPTTILAQQHYETFTERLAPYPVTIEVLSRFRSAREQNEVIARLKTGDVDIVIGTHRLVQADVGFKDLGLIIVDEEHRFGVGHKERLKELRREVDVLTLTATPIPRTLHMVLAGIRDISTIETPPEERLPIKTYLAEASDDLVREAVQRELDRGGQVYYLHNRVKTIDLAAGKLRELVPDARVLVAHGRMHEGRLLEVMEEFAAGGADVLVCTTIIESGLDIPGVNTLIVDRADRLGLAQLYQLRGRIGRRSQRAYAYLLVERGRRLSDAARRRLETIVAATELGAGFRIAMKDLEIRGAGNILGAEQSGQIHAVGFDLYTKLLAEAVEDLRAATGMGPEVARAGSEPLIDLGLPASIPDDLVPHMPTRMSMYQRLAKVRTIEDVEDLPREFEDRFGRPLPDELYHLLYGVRVRVLAKQAGVVSVVRKRGAIDLKLADEAGGARLALARAIGNGVTVGNQQVHLPEDQDKPWAQALLEVLEGIAAFRRQMMADVEGVGSAVGAGPQS